MTLCKTEMTDGESCTCIHSHRKVRNVHLCHFKLDPEKFCLQKYIFHGKTGKVDRLLLLLSGFLCFVVAKMVAFQRKDSMVGRRVVELQITAFISFFPPVHCLNRRFINPQNTALY